MVRNLPGRIPLLALALAAAPLEASFHLMQIEQVIGGVCGSPRHQAIQLRLRLGDQNLIGQARIRVWDAAGGFPIVVVDFGNSVPNAEVGDRVLVMSTEMATATGATPDFFLTQAIPESYLAAGRLTFENDGGTIYWSFAWGGADYTGSTTGSPLNDDNGDFGPPWGESLPWETLQAAQFTGLASAVSSTNAADYALTAGAASFTNNAGQSFVTDLPDCIFIDGFLTGDLLRWSGQVP
jgi:hypothetical protein